MLVTSIAGKEKILRINNLNFVKPNTFHANMFMSSNQIKMFSLNLSACKG